MESAAVARVIRSIFGGPLWAATGARSSARQVLVRGALLSALALVSMGCKCGRDRPYTPFGVASGVPSSPLPPAAPAASSSARSTFAAEPATPAPSGAASWQLGTMRLAAPAGRSFDRGLVADFDGDRNPEALVWTLSTTPDRPRGELWLYPAQGQPRPCFALPAFVPAAEGCRLSSSLSRTGPHTVTLDAAGACAAPAAPRSPERSITVLEPMEQRGVRFGLRIAAPAPGETLQVGVDSSDQDGDGRDDVRFTVRVGTGEKTAAANLEYLDRAAGPSRNPREPGASFAALANKASGLARSKKTASVAAELVMNARRLFASLCGESGSARLLDAEGAPLGCGNLDSFHERLAVAEALAALARGDLLGALGVLARDGWYGRAMSDQQRQSVEAAIESAARRVPITTVITPRATPVARGAEPRYSPLAFELPAQSLLIQTTSGMVRVSPDGTQEEPAPELRPWPLSVTLPSGARWTGYRQSCDRSEVELTLAGAEPTRIVVAELLSARPGGCSGAVPPTFPGPVVLGTRAGELEVVIAGAHVGPLGTPPGAGSARSADGQYLVVPSPLGVLVLGGDRPELWQSPRIAAPSALNDCVVANGASAVACTLAGQAVVLKK